MNKKLIATAVTAAVAVPGAAMAEITPYGRINNAIAITDTGSETNTDISGVASRFGFRGSADLGNGLTARGRYEFATVTDKEQPGIADIRISTVGLSGGFGSIDIGNQWSAYFDTFGTLVSPSYSLGYFIYSSIGGGPFRASNTIKYSNSFGPVYLELDVRLNESNEGGDVAEKINGDGFGLGVSIAATDNITIAIAGDSEENGPGTDDTDRFGVAVKASFGSFWGSLGTQTAETGSAEVDSTMLYLGTSFSDSTSAMIGFSTADLGGGVEPDSAFLGVYHNMGGGFRLWAEYTTLDRDDGSEDFSKALLGMRFDF